MASCKPVLFTASRTGVTYLFDEHGVWSIQKEQLKEESLPPVNRPHRVWSLVDASFKKEPEVSNVLDDTFFAVLAASPDAVRYKHWYTQNAAGIIRVVVSPWSAPELLKLCVADARDASRHRC